MDKLLPGHFIFIILSVAIVSLKTYPRVFLMNAFRDSWIAVIISSILIFALFLYITKVWKMSDEKNMVKLYQQAFGEKLGNFFIALFVVCLFLTLIESAAVEADSMHQTMLIETPKWFFLLFFIGPAIYVVSRNLVAISTISIIGIILIMIAGINLGILTVPNKEAAMLLPIFENGITGGFFIAILETLGQYGCASIALPYLSKIQDKKNKMMRSVVIAMIVLVQMEIVSTMGVLMTFTPDRAISLNYPKLLQTQLVSYSQFFDFGELYVMLQIVGGWLLKYVISFYSILIILRNYNVSRKSISGIIYGISALALVGSYYASKDSFILFYLLDYLQYIFLFNYVLIPLLVFAMIHIKIKLKLLSERLSGQ